jgi:hypothetical protein
MKRVVARSGKLNTCGVRDVRTMERFSIESSSFVVVLMFANVYVFKYAVHLAPNDFLNLNSDRLVGHRPTRIPNFNVEARKGQRKKKTSCVNIEIGGAGSGTPKFRFENLNLRIESCGWPFS